MIIPYFDMNVVVRVGQITFKQVSSVRIYESVTEIGNTAEIVLPREYQKLKGKSLLEYIKTGDMVSITLGYNERMEEEFTGFLTQPSADVPLVLRVDDLFWPLKQNNWIKSYKAATLKGLLTEIVPGYKIDCPSLSLGKYEINNASSFHVLKKLQQDYGLFSRIINKTLVVGYSWDWDFRKTEKHIYHMQKNIPADGIKLQWKHEADFNVRVQINVLNKHGKKKVVKHGSDLDHASVVSLDFMGLSDADAKKVAMARYKKYVFDGYTGSLKGWGLPRTHAGDSIDIQDDDNPEKQGEYLVEKVVIEFSDNGFTRENSLAYKIA